MATDSRTNYRLAWLKGTCTQLNYNLEVLRKFKLQITQQCFIGYPPYVQKMSLCPDVFSYKILANINGKTDEFCR